MLCFQIGKRNPSNLCHVRGDWGYAGDHDTVKCRLQVMMALFELRLEKGKPLEACTYLLPKFISKWNIEKGGVDDMSQVLAHVLNWCGPINPLQVMWLRVTFVSCLYNDWRIHELIETHDYLQSDQCSSFYKYQDKRQKVGKPFVDFLCEAFDALEVPADLNKGASPQKRGGDEQGSATLGEVSGNLEHLRRATWNTERYIEFRLDSSKKHKVCSFSQLQAVGAIDDPAIKRNKKVRLSEESQDSQESNVSDASRRRVDATRRWCAVCTTSIRVGGSLSTVHAAERATMQRELLVHVFCAMYHCVPNPQQKMVHLKCHRCHALKCGIHVENSFHRYDVIVRKKVLAVQ